MPGISSKLPEGWERSQTNTGIPYYINHEDERTQWDHPEMTSLMEGLDGLSNIKYAAYRTAMKLRAIQKKTQLYMVDLPVIIAALDEEGIRDGFTEGNLSVTELLRVITSIFVNQIGNGTDYMDISLNSELLLNWILNVYDPGRTGFVQIVSVKIGLAVMCSAKVQDKYRYIFRQLSTNQRYLDRRRLKTFLQEMLEIPKYIYESAAFSGSSVEPAVRNCLETVSIPEQVSVEEFVEWMNAEPQTIVWLPTLHRLAVSETVKHEAKCNVCKMYPIVGFRYRCLKCFNFDLCQECFWSGRVNKQHKIGHPTQEYCLVSTQKEDLKDFAKVVRNKVSKRKKTKQDHPSKGRYIPIGIEDTVPSDGDEDDYVDAPVTTKTFPRTHDKLGSYAARLANHESRVDEEEYKESTPSPRDSMDDEDNLIRHYTKILSEEQEEEAPYSTQATRPLDSKEKRVLENLITKLEDDNRALLGEIANIRYSERRGQEERSSISGSDSAEAMLLRQQRERLEARQEVLEAHNHQLQVQLHRLRTLLHQGDLSQISSFIKSNQTSLPLSSAALPDNTSTAPMTGLIPSRSLGISGGDVPSNAYRTTSATPQAAASSASPVPQHTFPSSMSSTRAYRPQYPLSPSIPPPGRDASWQTQPSGIRGYTNTPLSARVGGGSLAPKTAAELDLLDRPDSSVEDIEMRDIVDKMTAAFPLDDYQSDIPVDVHNDLFLAAALIGEALQSMVTTVSRATGAAKTSVDSRKPYEGDLGEAAHGQDNLGYGDWPLTDLEESNRLSIPSSTGYQYDESCSSMAHSQRQDQSHSTRIAFM